LSWLNDNDLSLDCNEFTDSKYSLTGVMILLLVFVSYETNDKLKGCFVLADKFVLTILLLTNSLFLSSIGIMFKLLEILEFSYDDL
jgi:hypothetical protein